MGLLGKLFGTKTKESEQSEALPKYRIEGFVVSAMRNGTSSMLYDIRAGMKVNAADEGSGLTALWAACNEDALDAVRVLLENGADPNLADARDGWTPLMVTANMRPRKSHFKNQRAIAELLLRHGADVTVREKKFGWTAWKIASDTKNTAVLDLLPPDPW
jgi:ankyrin repeat protein